MVNVASEVDGLERISNILGLCSPIQSIGDVSNLLWPWLSNVYSSLPMGQSINDDMCASDPDA
jgi:hypothetical protein